MTGVILPIPECWPSSAASRTPTWLLGSARSRPAGRMLRGRIASSPNPSAWTGTRIRKSAYEISGDWWRRIARRRQSRPVALFRPVVNSARIKTGRTYAHRVPGLRITSVPPRCPRTIVNSQRRPPAPTCDPKPARALNPPSNARDTLVMRNSAAPSSPRSDRVWRPCAIFPRNRTPPAR